MKGKGRGENGGVSSGGIIPLGPVFYPSEEEFRDPLEYIHKIRGEAEPYGICKIVPPSSCWKPPFALDMDAFTFPTKTQPIHQLQARSAPNTFSLDYNKPTKMNAKRRRKNKDFDQICEHCTSGLHGEVMLLCDRCNKGWHVYCLSPPLKTIPPGNWYCLECLNSDKDDSFGFVPGKEFSLEAFRRMADRVKKKWFGSAATSRVRLENKFWEIVEGSIGEVEVMYGSDLDTSVYGSGFPCHVNQRPPSLEVDIWNEYCFSPWNLNNLPRLQGSMLRTVHHNIAGVMVPWLYVGMLFSSFCWHFEDHCFYSMNYLHWGEPKCWYSVPGDEAHAFEKVMRESLPDLFEAQPDLLFQLVTMLNPSVLQEKGVPVYSIIQEPGNFVVTFPRSYHGGFNFGLNCAEAVNFAPADWLPHGGFGAELYRNYHKAAVLSHEELLCVVAKSECEGRVSTYLKKELFRICDNEKTWRERLWRNGIVRSSPMTPREQPDFVGTEEDPMCIICQQLLYLSAVSCDCRPSAFVCLEHSEHLCECKPYKLRLLYRHTLAELSDMLLKVCKHDCLEAADDLRSETCVKKAAALTKKVKGAYVTHVQLAERWILRSCKVLEHPYSRHASVSAMVEAEEFLWAGSEMDLVRDMVNRLVQAQNWAEAVRDCLSKLKSWSNDCNCDTDRVKMDHIDELLSLGNAPCNEPTYLLLKEYQEEASTLIEEINHALSLPSGFSVADWEMLHSKVVDLPIDIKETGKLKHKISSVKDWVDNVKKCITEKAPSSVEEDMLYKLELGSLELHLQLHEADLLINLIRQVESCRSSCSEVLKDPISLKEVNMFLSKWEEFTVNIPELKLLRKYYSDSTSWISRVNLALMNVHEREDQENVVNELMCIQRDGSLLKIPVDELPRLEIELERARCRVKAFKALRGKVSIGFIQQLILEATELQIEKEMLFTDVSGRNAVATGLEEKAQHILASKAQMIEFEDVLRASEDVSIVLTSIVDLKDAVSMAKAWLLKSKPFLVYDSSAVPASDSCLHLDVLKELVVESKHLKVSLEECSQLDKVLNKCLSWEKDASSLLQDMQYMCNLDIVGGSMSCLIPRFEHHILLMESAIKVGISLGFEFNMIPKLQCACSVLKWCIKAFSFYSLTPSHKDVVMMLDAAVSLPAMYESSALLSVLIGGLHWLKKAIEVLDPHNHLQFELSSVEEVLVQSKKICISFPMIIASLQDAVQNHNLWLEQVCRFFALGFEDRTWNALLQLKEHGVTAFACVELEKVLFEFEKVQQWKQQCEDIIKPSPARGNSLLGVLIEIDNSLARSLDMYRNYKNNERNICICCSSAIESHKLVICSICKDSFHSQCAKPLSKDAMGFVCQYCDLLISSKLSHGGFGYLGNGQKHLELDRLAILLLDANDLCLWTDERRILHQIVEKAHACNACLTELLDFALAHASKNLDVVTGKMCIALKAMDVAGVSDGSTKKNFELALARNSWKIRAELLLENPDKPTIQQIHHHLKEGLAIDISPEDYFRKKLTEFRDMGFQWADTAKKVSMDGGELGLDRVFELILEGENLQVSCQKELKLLRDRSMLYCICRRPYDQRAMIACDKCDEWYHFDCVKISSAPKTYICPACNLNLEEDMCVSARTEQDRSTGCKFEEPQTPLRRSELRRNSQKSISVSQKILVAVDINDAFRNYSGTERLLWRNTKRSRRAARKRSGLQRSPFCVQNS